MSSIIELEKREVEYHPLTKNIIRITYLDDKGMPHRINGPAIEIFTPTGLPISQIYCRHGVETREDGPAIERIDLEDGFHELIWKIDGKKDRDSKPAEIVTDVFSGVEFLVAYWKCGQRHREDGLAVLRKNRETGEFESGSSHINGVPQSSDEFTQPTPI